MPARLKRGGIAVRLVVSARGKVRAPDPRLVALPANARRRFTRLSSGHSDCVLSIAQAHGLASKDVTRVIYLAFLAPANVQKIVQGEQPLELGQRWPQRR